MINVARQDTTRRIGKSQGYKGLAITDTVFEGQQVMLSAWELTPAEAQRIGAGAPIYLWVLGNAHPPVMLEVGAPPDGVSVGQEPRE